MTEKAQPEDLAFLSRTATEFVEISFETDLYAHICTRLRELAGDVPVVVASYDKVPGTFTPRAFQGAPKVIDLYMKTAGVNPIGKEYHLSAAAAETMHARHMKPVTIDLYELSEHTVPALVCRAAEMAMNLGSIYAMGFTRMNELLGCASIFMP